MTSADRQRLLLLIARLLDDPSTTVEMSRAVRLVGEFAGHEDYEAGALTITIRGDA